KPKAISALRAPIEPNRGFEPARGRRFSRRFRDELTLRCTATGARCRRMRRAGPFARTVAAVWGAVVKEESHGRVTVEAFQRMESPRSALSRRVNRRRRGA